MLANHLGIVDPDEMVAVELKLLEDLYESVLWGDFPNRRLGVVDLKTWHRRWVGNVTLLESMINQAVNNINDKRSDWFAGKQEEYVKSDFVITNLLNPNYQIGKNTALNRFRENSKYRFDEWNMGSIETRQSIMMDLAFETWIICGERLDAPAA